MRELIDTHGIHAIKIWPFDGAARETGGQYVSQQQIDAALRPVRLLRDNFGDNIEILIEFHALWNVTSAARIARALEPYRPMWLEDMLMPGHFQQYRQLAESTSASSYHRGTNGREAPVPVDARVESCSIHHVRRLLVRRTDRGSQDHNHGGCVPVAFRASYCRRPAAVLRVHPPFNRDAERCHSGELSAILRIGLAENAGSAMDALGRHSAGIRCSRDSAWKSGLRSGSIRPLCIAPPLFNGSLAYAGT